MHAVAIAVPVVAQQPLVIPRLEGPVVVDGRIDEAAWETVQPLPIVTHLPNYGDEPSRRTEVRVAYDDAYVYVAAHCYTEPEAIYGTSLRRDIWTTGTDYIGVVFDSYLDRETALGFAVTPTGARVDYTVANDTAGSGAISTNWDGFWDAAVTRTEEGWFAEMRIPFSTLRFRDQDGEVRMGLILWRWMARDAEMLTFPEIPTRWGWWSWTKPSRAQEVLFEGISSRSPLYVTPYVLGGMGQSYLLDPAAVAYLRDDQPAYEAGLDVKYGVTSNLTLDLTLNTDFAQVEADDQQVNLTRFSLFFPEKRVFFQERASLFDFGPQEPSTLLASGAASTHRLFYSRRIGLLAGEPVRILGGARLAARLAGWDIGALSMQTARTNDPADIAATIPSENFGVARVRRPVINQYSYAGGMVTSRMRPDGQYNIAAGLDGVFRMHGEDYLSVAAAHSLDDGIPGGDAFENTRLHAVLERRSVDGFSYQVSVARSGAGYDPGTGFALRHDYTRLGDRLTYGWMSSERSRLQRHQLSLNSLAYLRNEGGSVETLELGAHWFGRFDSGSEVHLRTFLLREDLQTGFSLGGGVDVPAGTFAFPTFAGSYLMTATRRLRMNVSFTGGGFFDGYQFSPALEPIWIASRHIDLRGYYGLNVVRFPDRDQRLTAHIARVRLETMLDTRLSAVTFVQYNSAIDAVVANFRLRFNRGDGRDFYLVYNEQMNTDRYHLTPILPRTTQRTMLAKYTHTLVW